MMHDKTLKFALLGATAVGLLALAPLSFAKDVEFVKKAAQGNLMEVQVGGMAQEKAASDEVKDFGRRMVADHSKANDQLKPIAEKLKVNWPNALNAEGKQMHAELEKLQGAEFDRKYVDEMVKDHKKDVEKYKKAQVNVKDKNLREYVNKTLPILQEHLMMAKSLKANMSGQGTGSGSAAGSSAGEGASTPPSSMGLGTPPADAATTPDQGASGSGTAGGMGSGATSGDASMITPPETEKKKSYDKME